MKTWQHDELAQDLGDNKETGFLDVPLGSVVMHHSQRADVVEVKPSFTRFCISIYEVKISRADFQSDIRSGKWLGYLPHCHRFYFACPSGMINKNEVPPGAGLIVRGDKGWTTVKAAPVMKNEIPTETMMALIFSRQRENWYDKKRNRVFAVRRSYTANRKYMYKALGKEIGDALRNRDEYLRNKKYYEKYEELYWKLQNEHRGR